MPYSLEKARLAGKYGSRGYGISESLLEKESMLPDLLKYRKLDAEEIKCDMRERIKKGISRKK